MNDLISRQAAIDALGDIHPLDYNAQAYKARIEKLPSAQQWIPTTERLPEETGIYPVWTARGFGNHFSASYWDGKEWSLRVVAWMPLPDPWKGEEDEQAY